MKDFLDDFIVTLSDKRQTAIYDILSASRVGKKDIDKLVDKLKDIKKSAPLVLSREGFGSLIKSDTFDNAHRDGLRRLLELFEVSNTISLVLDTYTGVLSSEIKSIEDDILAVEKALDTYAFLLADNGFYDYAFLETFNDDTMMEKEFDFPLTDRSGIEFSDSELAIVNGNSGMLSLAPTLSSSYPLFGDIFKSNCLGYATSKSGLFKAFTDEAGEGWKVSMSSVKPFSSKLYDDLNKVGAQIELEIFLSVPSPCDTLYLVPFSDMPLDILKVVIYNNDSNDPITIHNGNSILDKPITINFPMQVVSKFRVILNQSVYKRGELPAARHEKIYRDFYNELKENREEVFYFTNKKLTRNKKAFKRIFLKSLKKNNPYLFVFKAELPELDFDPTFGPLTISKLVKGYDSSDPFKNIWEGKSKVNTFLRGMIDNKLFPTRDDLRHQRGVFNADVMFMANNTPLKMNMMNPSSYNHSVVSAQHPPQAAIIANPVLSESSFLDYQYSIGLRNIKIGLLNNSYRGIFISKILPCPSDSGEVKLKVSDANYELLDTSRDSSIITSIEYSIANKAVPAKEEDWLPILPINQDFVEAERVFPNEGGYCKLRFPASLNDVFEIYKNGYRIDTSKISKAYNNDSTAIIGFTITPSFITDGDIFTINYKPFTKSSIIRFDYNDNSYTNLASAFDSQGAGETFSSTGNSQTITLANQPFVNYQQVLDNGGYSLTAGFTGSYQPITIVMADGTVAYNLTNYKGLTQASLADFDSSKIAFIHSNNNIIFNQALTNEFTVYYQFLPSNLRFRIIMRVNDPNYISPTVDFVNIKTKTRKSDPRRVI